MILLPNTTLKHFKHLQTQPPYTSNIFKYLQIRYACGIIWNLIPQDFTWYISRGNLESWWYSKMTGFTLQSHSPYVGHVGKVWHRVTQGDTGWHRVTQGDTEGSSFFTSALAVLGCSRVAAQALLAEWSGRKWWRIQNFRTIRSPCAKWTPDLPGKCSQPWRWVSDKSCRILLYQDVVSTRIEDPFVLNHEIPWDHPWKIHTEQANNRTTQL